ncbi:glycosyltransferase family 4 protein [Effusibacillus consociatus]|uniref:Glycosyltransferase family 4 protein n=1 Tax=Effusibacillus consociatus TaxID=1117041 RepID=A0ABV9PUI9_9BACL
MKIGFHFSQTWDWSDEDFEGRGIGGTEGALVSMARELAKHNQVYVYKPTSKPGQFHGVNYVDHSLLNKEENFDVFISISRTPLLPDLNSKVKIHWSMEDSETWVQSWQQTLPYIDSVFTISPFHTEHLMKNYQIPRHMIFETTCGISSDLYKDKIDKVKNQLIYCSVPNRGLALLEHIFFIVSSEIPDVSLIVTSDFTLWGHADPGNSYYREIFSKDPRVRFLGKVPREELIYHQKTSVLHVYPCIVNELCCISSLECQAAGTPTIATKKGALETTVAHGYSGYLIDSNPFENPDFHQEFADCIISLLKNPKKLEQISNQARARSLSEFDYAKLAKEWMNKFKELLG